MLVAEIEVARRTFPVLADLRVDPGQRLAVHGPSGAGKTTVLEAIAGVVPLRRGLVRLGPRVLSRTASPRLQVPIPERRVGLLRQAAMLFPHLTVAENLGYSRRGPGGRPAGPDPGWLALLVERLGLQGLLEVRPAGLSGGQSQRVALARVLASDHQALLLDEPLTGQDPALRLELRLVLAELIARRPVPALLVTHDLDEAQAFGDRLAVMDRGRVLQLGPPAEVVRRPASRRVAELVGYSALIATDRCRFPGSGAPAPGWVAVHPDKVVMGAVPAAGPSLQGRVVSVHPSGALWSVWSQLESGERIRLRLPLPVAAGEPVTVTLVDPPLFDATGQLVPVPRWSEPDRARR